jgi:hypothetical protein
MNAMRRLRQWNPQRVPRLPRRDSGGKATSVRTRLLKLATLLGALTALWACNAPFIPVPPPGATFESKLVDDGTGTGGQKTVWITHGIPFTNAAFAHFFIFDEQTGNGVITTAAADGTYTAPPLDGTMGDHVRISFQTPGGDYSESSCLLLTTDVVGSSAPRCPPPPP